MPYFSTVKFELTKVQSVDESLYRSFLDIFYLVFHVLSSNNCLILNLLIEYKKSLVKIENQL